MLQKYFCIKEQPLIRDTFIQYTYLEMNLLHEIQMGEMTHFNIFLTQM